MMRLSAVVCAPAPEVPSIEGLHRHAGILSSVGTPLPPTELMARVGGVVGSEYEAWGGVAKRDIVDLLPWPLRGKRVLDFGCGAGRILRHLREARLAACDIDAPSVEWVRENIRDVDAFLVTEEPGIPRPDGAYDLVIAASVFTHIGATWLAWLQEIRRVLAADGLLFATFLGSGMEAEFGTSDGMTVVLDHGPDKGGPVVTHSSEWIRRHWAGAGFEVMALRESGFAVPQDRSRGHGVVLMRRR